MSFRNRETLHGWKLMAPCSVSYLQSAYALITADHLPIGVFNGRDVALSESALHKSQDQRTFSHSSSSKHNYPIIVALLRHVSLYVTCSARGGNLGEKTTKTRRETLLQVQVWSACCDIFPSKRNKCNVSDSNCTNLISLAGGNRIIYFSWKLGFAIQSGLVAKYHLCCFMVDF